MYCRHFPEAEMKAMVATRKGLFELERTAQGWQLGQPHFAGEPVSIVLHDRRDGADYAALHLGHFGCKLHRRDKGASDWQEVSVPAYPAQPEGTQDEVEWKLKMIWSLEASGADQPGQLWAGTLPGGLFRSLDRGASWELDLALWDAPERKEWMGGGYDTPGIHSICVDPRNSRKILLGISCGGAWRSEDGGASWRLSAKGMTANYMPPERAEDQAIQDPHRIVRCVGEPDVLWCQHHSGMWRSSDDGLSWQRINQGGPVSDFGFAVAAHPRDGNTAWFAPAVADQKRIPVDAALAVTRTSDGGASFTSLRTGLPQQHCYDLVYRHGLEVADDGKTLLMASTTGCLWVSEDAGESWQAISTNLPPIYAVRFC
jgi:hypothetical protein